MIAAVVDFLNNIVWSGAMLVLLVGTGIYFSFRLGFFQITNQRDMWKSIFNKDDSKEGISTFASFCATMAARIGTGNVAGVAVAIFHGGPGALFWMWIAGFTNSALSFAECTLGQLYKTKIDGEYRGSGAYCAERGLGWKTYGKIMSFILMIGEAVFMPAAASYTICDSFSSSWNIPNWISALFLSMLFAVIIIGGIKRIGRVASYTVPFMTIVYLLIAVIIIIMNITKIPEVLVLIFKSAFNRGAVMGGIEGGLIAAILQGVKRGTFSSAAGMGESTPAASAAETTHPIKQGMANAAGVFLDTIVVCSATGFMILMTDCFNTSPEIGGYVSSAAALTGLDGGVQYVQEACKSVLGSFAPSFISLTLFLFSFTCIISYYYESETSALHFFSGSNKTLRKAVIWIIRVVMISLIFVWGISESEIAWNAADLALGTCTWINVIMLWFLFPKVVILYKDYMAQKKAKKDPHFDPDKTEYDWRGVDKSIWRSAHHE